MSISNKDKKPVTKTRLVTQNCKQGYFVYVQFGTYEPPKSSQIWLVNYLYELFGPTGKRYNYRYEHNGLEIRFNEEKDVSWLAMKL